MTLTEIKTMLSTVTDLENKVDWKSLSSYDAIDEDFVNQYYDYLDINRVLTHTQVSETFMTDHLDLGFHVFRFQNPSETYLKSLAEEQYSRIPDIIFAFGNKVSDTFKTQCKNIIYYYQDQPDYEYVNALFWMAINNSICGQSFIETNYAKFVINEYLKKFDDSVITLDETFITNHFSDIDPIVLLKSKKLSETFISTNISTFTDEATYPHIMKTLLRTQDLSVSFIESTLLTNGFDMEDIVRYCTLDETFVQTHIADIDLKLLNKETCKNITESFILSHVEDVDLHQMIHCKTRSVSFLDTLVNNVPQLIDARITIDISATTGLTEAFVTEHTQRKQGVHHGELLSLQYVFRANSYPPSFIDGFKDHPLMDANAWIAVLEKQVLDAAFIKSNIDYISPFLEKAIQYQPCMDQILLEEIMDLLEMTTAQRNQLYAYAMQYIHISRLTIQPILSTVTPKKVAKYQIYDPDLYFPTATATRDRYITINFNRDIAPFNPCQEGIDWYTADWGLDDEVDYNDILTKIKSTKKHWYLEWFWTNGLHKFGSHSSANFLKP